MEDKTGELLQRVVDGVAKQAPSGWRALRLTHRATVGTSSPSLMFELDDGTTVHRHPPIEIVRPLRNLRREMYQPGRGTWFTATIDADSDGTYRTDFDYDNAPAFDPDLVPGSFALDLKYYPRDAEHIPEWLAAKLREAEG